MYIWDISGGTIFPWHILQKRAVKVILYAPYRAHSEPLFHKLNILTIYYLCLTQILTFVYKSVNHLLPSHCTNYFTRASDIHSHATRGHEHDLYLTNAHKTCRINSLTFRGPKYWKTLPDSIDSGLKYRITAVPNGDFFPSWPECRIHNGGGLAAVPNDNVRSADWRVCAVNAVPSGNVRSRCTANLSPETAEAGGIILLNCYLRGLEYRVIHPMMLMLIGRVTTFTSTLEVVCLQLLHAVCAQNHYYKNYVLKMLNIV